MKEMTMSAKVNHFQPSCEALERRWLMSASPVPSALSGVAQAFTHGSEYYTRVVTGDYQHFLGRAPAAAEVASWVIALERGMTDVQLEADFISSSEFVTKNPMGGYWIDAVFRDLLNRGPKDKEYDALIRLSGGIDGDCLRPHPPGTIVNFALIDGPVKMSANQLAPAFASSPERVAQRIQDDYVLLLHRAASTAEVKAWQDTVAQHSLTNQDVLARLLISHEYEQDQGFAPQKQNYPYLPNGYVIELNGILQPGTAESYLEALASTGVDWLYGVYRDVLGRAPDMAGMNAWLQSLGSCYSVDRVGFAMTPQLVASV
jgi:hypothetical protein